MALLRHYSNNSAAEERAREAEEAARQAHMKTQLEMASQQAREWCDENGITSPGMTRAQRNAATARFRTQLKSTPMVAHASPKAWAYSLKSDYLDGKPLLLCQIETASAALKETWSNGQCKPLEIAR